MSCSITSTVWSPAISMQQLAGALALVACSCRRPARRAAAAGPLHEQHADLQPLPLAVREDAGRAVREVGQADRRPAPRPTSSATPRAPAQQRRQRPPEARRQVEVLQDGQLLEHHRGLEGAADARAARSGAPCGRRASCPANVTVPVGRLGQAGDHVDQRGLAGAVGADQEAQLALVRRVRSRPSIAWKPSKTTSRPRISERARSCPSPLPRAVGVQPAARRSRARRLGQRRRAARGRPGRPGRAAPEHDHRDEQRALEVEPAVRRNCSLKRGLAPS